MGAPATALMGREHGQADTNTLRPPAAGRPQGSPLQHLTSAMKSPYRRAGAQASESLDLGAFSEYPYIWMRHVSVFKTYNGTAAGTGIGDVSWHVPRRCGGALWGAQGGPAGARDRGGQSCGGRLYDDRAACAGSIRRIWATHRRVRVDRRTARTAI